MKYCPYCGYSPIHDDAEHCPSCGEDVTDQVPYDYPQEEQDRSYYEDTPLQDTKKKKHRTGNPLAMKIGFVVAGFVIIVAACICVLCLL